MNKIKQTFGQYFYQIGQQKYQTTQIKQYQKQFEKINSDLENLYKLQIHTVPNENLALKIASKKWNSKTQIIENSIENQINLYISNLESVLNVQISQNDKSTLHKNNPQSLKLANQLSGQAKFEILETLENLL